MKVFITGASEGLGRALAKEYAAIGADLFICARSTDKLSALANELSGENKIKCRFTHCNVTNIEDIRQAVDNCVESIGIPDIIILNSGISKNDNFKEFDMQIIKDIFEVNVFGILNCLEVFIPLLLKSGSSIIAGVTSLAEARGVPGNAGYTSSKIAASHLLEAARMQLKNTNIKISTIKPGFIKTNMTSKNSFPMPFVLEPEKAAKIIIKRLQKGKTHISFPMPIALFSWFGKLVPAFIYEFLMSKFKKNILEA
jgi:short-subunit dehydrogenase